jgi:hypothetical protein
VDRFLRPGGEPLDVPVGGDDTTLFYSQCGMWTSGVLDEQCISTHSSLFRVVYGFDESGLPVATWNAANQVDGEVEAWRAGTYHAMPFSRAEVEAAALSSEAMGP